MRTIGVRELRTNASKVLHELSANGEVVEITRHGRVIARLVPAGEGPARTGEAGIEAVWADMDRLSEELSAHWPEGVSATEAVSRDRR
ncbi:MAG TPA: type II toxin-antitoxin system prevent-host-death family antitoxin [Dehalococcoidia bacterium]|nr:type II toxin-antitoxin system prevent-host-death family antitoxin [Dehalococcoidia bacterium]